MPEVSLNDPLIGSGQSCGFAPVSDLPAAGGGSASPAASNAFFSTLELEVIELGLLEGQRPLARGARPPLVARAVDWLIVVALGERGGRALADPRLEALRRFTASARQRHGTADPRELSRFLRAGFARQHALEIESCATHTTKRSGRHARASLRARLDRGIARHNMLASGLWS